MTLQPAWSHGRAMIYRGSADAVFAQLPGESVHCVVTSPPYYGLRRYLADGHADAALELGTERTPDEYVTRLVAVLREVRRVLRSDGLAFVNIGTTFASGKIDTQEYVLRDDLTAEETAYVYEELAKHLRSQSTTVPEVRRRDASPEQAVPRVPDSGGLQAGELSGKGV